MRVKEKPLPSAPARAEAAGPFCMSSPKRQSLPEFKDQVLDLSKSSKQPGVTETDAIHRRLNSSDRGVEALALSVMESMEESRKRTRYPSDAAVGSKSETFVGSKSDSIDHVSEKQLVRQVVPCQTEPQLHTMKAVECDIKPQSAAVTTDSSVAVDSVKVGPSNGQDATVKTKKKPGRKRGQKKKVVKKRSFQNQDDSFEIDPRLGGSKIKNAVSKKAKKDKKLKSVEPECKKMKITEQRFPYIHIEGSWNVPNVVKIVNGHIKEDETEGKFVAKVTRAAQYVDEEHRSRAAKVGFTSTLSDRYDAHNRDVTWLCIFCQQYTHMQCLGDLYGPYYVNQVGPPPETKLGGTTNNWGKKTVLKETLLLFMSQVDAEPVWSSRKGKETNTAPPASPPRSASKKAKKSPKKKVGLKTETMSPVPSVGFSSSAKTPVSATPSPLVPNNQTEQKMEVWFHESCLVWAPGVCLVPPRIAGLDEAIADSQQVICDYCQKVGAHIFCRKRGCKVQTHLPCATSNHWVLQEETFLALCPEHKDHPPPT